MGNTPDSKFDMGTHNSDSDPFAESPELGESGDPFDFVPEEPAERSIKQGNDSADSKMAKKRSTSTSSGPIDRQVAGLSADVTVQVVAVLGKKATTVKEIVSLKKGQVIELNRFPNEAVDLVANGKLMAKGELVEIDGKLGVRIIKIFE
jgi:flagellar motor switch protein FliM